MVTPNQDILRFKWHTVTLIPMNQLPSGLACRWAADAGICRLWSGASPPGSVFRPRWKVLLVPSSKSVTVASSPTLVLLSDDMGGVRGGGVAACVGVSGTQLAQGGARCETRAEVSGEVQLSSG